MATTSGMSYAVHYDLSGRAQDGILQDFSRMRIETAREPPVLYVAMATWIPKCNMYQHNCEPLSTTTNKEDRELETETEIVVTEESQKSVDAEQKRLEEKPDVEEKHDDKSEAEEKPDEHSVVKDEPPKEVDKPVKQLEEKLTITPKKAMSPKQLQKKLESEKKRQQKQQERDERERKKQEERERLRLEKEKQRQEKETERLKLKQEKEREREMKEEQKRKEREEKEAKRKEKEEREEQKRKEREQEKLRKQQEMDEKNKEKQKEEERKQKAAASFMNFFVAKKNEAKVEEDFAKTSIFMPFQVKSDMKLPPNRRPVMTNDEKLALVTYLDNQDENASYLRDLKEGKSTGKSSKTWPYEDDDIVIVEEDFGESICEDKPKTIKMRAKFFKFRENRRPAYFGTWRKKSRFVKARKPFGEDKLFDYEVDSDDDWEEEEQGESLNGSDDEEKENELENDDYEVDNDFFVPHGHLSDDEIDDEATSKLSPESHKQKLKLLKDEFDQDMQTKTHKIKPRSIGCVWCDKDSAIVDESADRYLRPLAWITNGRVVIKKRKDLVTQQTPTRKYVKELRQDLIPAFLKLIHGNTNKRTTVVDDFIDYMQNNGFTVDISKASLGKNLKHFAQWKKCTEEGPMLNKFCWCVEDEVKNKYNI